MNGERDFAAAVPAQVKSAKDFEASHNPSLGGGTAASRLGAGIGLLRGLFRWVELLRWRQLARAHHYRERATGFERNRLRARRVNG